MHLILISVSIVIIAWCGCFNYVGGSYAGRIIRYGEQNFASEFGDKPSQFSFIRMG